MSEVGFVAWPIEGGNLGSQTAEATDIGTDALHLVVTNIADFLGTEETKGGWLDIGQAAQPLVFTDAFVNDDLTTGTITLEIPLEADVDEGVRVDLWTADEVVVSYTVGVLYAGIPEPVEAVVPHHFITHLSSQAAVGAQVSLEIVDGALTITDVPHRTPSVNLGYASDDPIHPPAVTNSWQQHPDDFASTAKPEFLGDGGLTGNVKVQGTLKSGGSAGVGEVVVQQQGFVTRKSTGETVSLYSNNDEQPDVHRGRIEGTEAVLSGSTFMDGAVQVGQGTSVKFRSTTIPPVVSPTGDEDWPAVDGDFNGFMPDQRIGCAVVSPSEMYQLATSLNGSMHLVGVDPTTGALLGVYSLTGGPSNVFRCGVTYSSLTDRLYTLGTDGMDWLVESWAMPSGGASVFDAQEFVWTGGEHPGNPSTVMPTLTCAVDSGQDRVILAQTHRGDGTVNYAQYLDGVFDDQGTTTTPLNLGDLAGVAVLDGFLKIVLASSQTTPGNPYRDADGNVGMPLVTLSSGVVSSDMPVGESNPACAGISTLDGDTELNRVWYVSRSSDRVIQHSNPSTVGFIWLKGAWGDSASGGVTLPGPEVKLTKRPGTRIGVVLSALPMGVDSGLLYAATGNTLPPNANWHAQNAPLTAGPVFCQIFNVGTSGANPKTPGTEDFPTGGNLPSTILSDDDSVVIEVSTYSNVLSIPERLDALETGTGDFDGGTW